MLLRVANGNENVINVKIDPKNSTENLIHEALEGLSSIM